MPSASSRLHPRIGHELAQLRTGEPRNVLEWMFRYSHTRSPPPIPHAVRPVVVTTDFRRHLATVYEGVPAWVKADTPVLTRSTGVDWEGLPDQVIRNLACWLGGVSELLKGRSFGEVNEWWPCRPAVQSVVVAADVGEAEVVKKEE